MSIEKEIDQMAENFEKSQKPSLEDTIWKLGPEGLKKAMPDLTEDQKTLLVETLDDMKKSIVSDEYEVDETTQTTINGEMVQNELTPDQDFQDEEVSEETREKQMQEIRHQGGVPVEGWEGQVVKAEKMYKKDGEKAEKKEEKEEADEKEEKEGGEEKEAAEKKEDMKMKKSQAKENFTAMLKRMQDRDLEKSKCVKVLAKNMEASEEKISEVWDLMQKAYAEAEMDKDAKVDMPEKDQSQVPGQMKQEKEGEEASEDPAVPKKKQEDKGGEKHSDVAKQAKETADEGEQPPKTMKKSEEEMEKAGKSVQDYVDMILSDKLQVQDVMEKVPDDMKDDVLAALREKKAEKGKMKKSDGFFFEDSPVYEAKDDFFKSNTFGKNTHYDVDSYIESQESSRKEQLSKSTFDYDAKDEGLTKSEVKPVSINDILEKGEDMGSDDYNQKVNEQFQKSSGAFLVKSFDDSDMDQLFFEQDMFKSEDLEKGKKPAPIGAKSPDGKKVKTAQGWKPVKGSKKDSKKEESESSKDSKKDSNSFDGFLEEIKAMNNTVVKESEDGKYVKALFPTPEKAKAALDHAKKTKDFDISARRTVDYHGEPMVQAEFSFKKK